MWISWKFNPQRSGKQSLTLCLRSSFSLNQHPVNHVRQPNSHSSASHTACLSSAFQTSKTYTVKYISLLVPLKKANVCSTLVLAQGCWNSTNTTKNIQNLACKNVWSVLWSEQHQCFFSPPPPHSHPDQASCSAPCYLLWLFWLAASKTAACTSHHKISCWQDYSWKHNKAHVVVAINTNFAGILRTMQDSAQHGCQSFTAWLSS